MCRGNNSSAISTIFNICDIEDCNSLSLASFRLLVLFIQIFTFFPYLRNSSFSEPPEHTSQIFIIDTGLFNSFSKDLEQINPVWLNYNLETLVAELFSRYSCEAGIGLEGFTQFLNDFPSILNSILQAFTHDFWTVDSFPMIKIPQNMNSTINKEKSYDTIYVLKDHSLIKYYAAFRGPLLLLMTQDKVQKIEHAIFLEECYIKETSKFSVWLLSIFHSTQYDPRLILAFRSEQKQIKWLSRLSHAGKIRKVKEVYCIENKIKSGKYSEVFVAIHKETKEKFVAKIIRKRKLDYIERELMRNEVSILSLLDHENIVRLVDVFHSQKSLILITELIEGEELTKVIKSTAMNEEVVRSVVFQLLKVLEYLNSLGILHRDIKAENIILVKGNDGPFVKLLDFGFATFDLKNSLNIIHCGTLGYSAPEILKKEPYGKSIDMWSIGILAFAMVTGKIPIYDSDHRVVISKTVNLEIDYMSERWKDISFDCMDFVQNLLKKVPDERLGIQQALAHPWFTSKYINDE